MRKQVSSMAIHHSTSGSQDSGLFREWMEQEMATLRYEMQVKYYTESWDQQPPTTDWHWLREEWEPRLWAPASHAHSHSTRNATGSGLTEDILSGMDAAAEATLLLNGLSTKSGTVPGPISFPTETHPKKGTFGQPPTSTDSPARRR